MFRHYALYHLKTNRQLHMGMVLFVVGLLLSAGAWRIGSQWNWTPVDVPLPLNGPISLNVPFTTHTPRSQRYTVSFATMQDGSRDVTAGSVPNAEGQKLQITANGQVLKDVEDAPAQVELGHWQHSFYIPSGQHCVVHLHGKPLPPEWRPFKPHLMIFVLPDGEVMIPKTQTVFFVLTGFVMAVSGMVLLIRSLKRGWTDYKDRFAPQPED